MSTPVGITVPKMLREFLGRLFASSWLTALDSYNWHLDLTLDCLSLSPQHPSVTVEG